MKKSILVLSISFVLSMLISCTADDIEQPLQTKEIQSEKNLKNVDTENQGDASGIPGERNYKRYSRDTGNTGHGTDIPRS